MESVVTSKKFIPKIADTKVPGRKSIVTAAMVIIDELSFLASSAIFLEVLAIWMFILLSF